MTSITDAAETLERIADLEEERDYWKAKSEEHERRAGEWLEQAEAAVGLAQEYQRLYVGALEWKRLYECEKRLAVALKGAAEKVAARTDA